MKFKLLTFSLLLCQSLAFAQFQWTATGQNNTIIDFLKTHPSYSWKPNHKHKWGMADTLELPFFDDFSYKGIYPDSTLWVNNLVFVNAQFGFLPPTIGVATFDQLGADGLPYGGTLNARRFNTGDSLISQPINLNDSAGVLYTPNDSFYLSFFYQPNGFGHELGSQDSFRLFLKAESNLWHQVWSAGGSSSTKPFKQVNIAIVQDSFLHAGFQFMFKSFTRQSGNANQWQLDYVYLDKNRTSKDTIYEDYAIQTIPTSLLKNYHSMPYKHFVGNENQELASNIVFNVSNLYSSTCNCEVKHSAINKGTNLVATVFSDNANNVLPQNNALRQFPMFGLNNLAGDANKYVIDRKTELREANSNGIRPQNNSFEQQQVFHDYFAYDDGSAEMGFGFDQETNPKNIEGAVALRYKLNVKDTLNSIGVFFNNSIYDVSKERFRFMIWREIKNINGGVTDNVLYQSAEFTPRYVEGNNRFFFHELAEPLVIDAGNVFIGWRQNTMYNLNIGWDRNSGNLSDSALPKRNLYYQVFDVWRPVSSINGALMMRPYFGSTKSFVSTDKITKEQAPTIYPNPSRDYLNVQGDYSRLMLRNSLGQQVEILENKENRISISHLPQGIYFVETTLASGASSVQKLIIQP